MELVIIAVVLVAGIAIGYLVASQRAVTHARTGETLRDAIGGEAADALERVQEQLVTLERGRVGSEARLQEQVRAMADTSAHLRTETAQLVTALRAPQVRGRWGEMQLERGRVGSEARLQEQVRAMADTSAHLRTETAQLVTALRAPQVRGRWGEMQLERVVEAAGMAEHVDYVTQVSAPGEGGTQRPDLVVRLAGGKQVVVDSKVAFSAYLDAMQARDEATRDARLRAHAKHLRQHIDQLSAKSYWERFTPSPEFVVCFVPADAFLDAALREDADLLEHAFARDVVLATPTTLVALLRTIAYTWRQEQLAENAAAIHELGRELYRRISTMGGHVERLGRSLSGAVSAYNDAVGSLERRVVSTARRMSELGVVAPGTELHAAEPLLDAVPRPLASAELVEPRLVAVNEPGTSRPLGRVEPTPGDLS